MNRHSLTALLVIVASISLNACETTDPVYKEKIKRDEYLKKSYPAEKQSPDREQPALKTKYYNEITAGKVVTGMSFIEAQLASKTYPYGSNRYNTVFWCNEQLTDSCNATCDHCAGVLLTANRLHYLQGEKDQLLVENSIPRQIDDTVAKLKRKPYQVINALFRNRVVTGMTIQDFQRIEQQPGTKTEFYCKSQRVFQSCLLDCGECVLKIITPRNDRLQIQTVRFRGHNDFATIVDVTSTIASSSR